MIKDYESDVAEALKLIAKTWLDFTPPEQSPLHAEIIEL